MRRFFVCSFVLLGLIATNGAYARDKYRNPVWDHFEVNSSAAGEMIACGELDLAARLKSATFELLLLSGQKNLSETDYQFDFRAEEVAKLMRAGGYPTPDDCRVPQKFARSALDDTFKEIRKKRG